MCLASFASKRSATNDELHRSTSKLIVSDWVLLFTSDLELRARNHHGYKRGMADASTSRVRARVPSFCGYRERASPVRLYIVSCGLCAPPAPSAMAGSSYESCLVCPYVVLCT